METQIFFMIGMALSGVANYFLAKKLELNAPVYGLIGVFGGIIITPVIQFIHVAIRKVSSKKEA